MALPPCSRVKNDARGGGLLNSRPLQKFQKLGIGDRQEETVSTLRFSYFNRPRG